MRNMIERTADKLGAAAETVLWGFTGLWMWLWSFPISWWANRTADK